MLKENTNFAGFKVPSLLFYGVVLGAIYYVGTSFKNGISNGIGNLFKSDSDKQKDTVTQDVFKTIEKDPNVKNQMNPKNMLFANTLHDAMNGFGTKYTSIANVFEKLTGPYQIAAVVLAYGKRKLTAFGITTYEGDLISSLMNECSVTFLNENRETRKGKKFWSIQMQLNTLKRIK